MPRAKKNIIKLIPDETIIRKIYVIRGHKVMLDFDLAVLYEVETKRLNEQVKRNIDRFPEDFMFRLTQREWEAMRSQIATASAPDTMRSQIVTASKKDIRSQFATASQKKRNVNVTPYAFTEHGVTMLASILKSEKAVKMSIVVVRAFIELTRSALQYGEITKQLQALKEHLGEHDVQLNQIYDAIENLLDDKAEQKTWDNRKRIGFK
jgi:phage regulator Rha-like protein